MRGAIYVEKAVKTHLTLIPILKTSHVQPFTSCTVQMILPRLQSMPLDLIGLSMLMSLIGFVENLDGWKLSKVEKCIECRNVLGGTLAHISDCEQQRVCREPRIHKIFYQTYLYTINDVLNAVTT